MLSRRPCTLAETHVPRPPSSAVQIQAPQTQAIANAAAQAYSSGGNAQANANANAQTGSAVSPLLCALLASMPPSS